MPNQPSEWAMERAVKLRNRILGLQWRPSCSGRDQEVLDIFAAALDQVRADTARECIKIAERVVDGCVGHEPEQSQAIGAEVVVNAIRAKFGTEVRG